MTGVQAFLAVSVLSIALITYSALVASNKQEDRMIQRFKEEKLQKPFSSTRNMAFETSEELDQELDKDNIDEDSDNESNENKDEFKQP